MSSSIRKIPHPLIGRATTSASIPAALSTSGGVWGRGGPTPFIFTVDSSTQTEADTPKDDSPSPLGHGHGHGSGKPLHSPSILPSFPSFVNNEAVPAAIGRGRGDGFIPTKTIPPQQRPPPNPDSKKPYLFAEDDAHRDSTDSESPVRHEKILPSEIINILSGAGRGKPTKPEAAHALKPKTENRDVRPQQPTKPKSSAEEHLTPEEKLKKVVGFYEMPPIPMRDAIEKRKRFLMRYEGIQSQEEWEVKNNHWIQSREEWEVKKNHWIQNIEEWEEKRYRVMDNIMKVSRQHQ